MVAHAKIRPPPWSDAGRLMPDLDPRTFPAAAAAPAAAARLHALAAASLGAATGIHVAAQDERIVVALRALLLPGNGDALEQLFATAPSVAIHRHLWRLLAQSERAVMADGVLRVTVFALPLVIVAGVEGGRAAQATLPCVLENAAELAAILRGHGALAGNQNFALSNALIAANSLELAQLPELLAAGLLPDRGLTPRALVAAPIQLAGAQESVHLRFMLGTAIAASGVDLTRDASVGPWGLPLAQALGRQMSVPGLSTLVLPRRPQPLVPALQQGRAAHREVAAQVFASNAIRKLRAGVGEPAAVISLHRAADANGGGEVRLSLSSPFDPREAEGFRCPLYASDRVPDVVAVLTELMRDCRVGDVRVLPGIHADRDAATGLPLLFKGDQLPDSTTALH
jgi:hypothetical protein